MSNETLERAVAANTNVTGDMTGAVGANTGTVLLALSGPLRLAVLVVLVCLHLTTMLSSMQLLAR